MPMICPRCAVENGDAAKFCKGCGFDLRSVATAPIDPVELAATTPCGKCGVPNLASARFCKSCGNPLGAVSSATATTAAAVVIPVVKVAPVTPPSSPAAAVGVESTSPLISPAMPVTETPALAVDVFEPLPPMTISLQSPPPPPPPPATPPPPLAPASPPVAPGPVLRPLPGLDTPPVGGNKSPVAMIVALVSAFVLVIAGGAWWFMSGSHAGSDNAAVPVIEMTPVPTPASSEESATTVTDMAAPAETVVETPSITTEAGTPVAVEALPVERPARPAPAPVRAEAKPAPPKPKPIAPPKITFTPVGPQTGIARQPVIQAPTPAPAPVAASPASPEEACGKRVFIAMTMCIARQCGTPQFASHPQCVQLRKQEQDRKNREDIRG